MKNENKHLYYLEELSDYKVDSHYSDVRGWAVKDRDNRVIGKVANLLVNKNLEKVVYLDVEVDDTIIEANHDPYASPTNAEVREFVNKKGENHIIVPIGMVTINDEKKFVFTDSIDLQTFAGTKRIKSGTNINRDYEVMVMDSFNRDQQRNEGDIKKIIEEFKAERKNLEEEVKKLRKERFALEEERKKLEAELRKKEPDYKREPLIESRYDDETRKERKKRKPESR